MSMNPSGVPAGDHRSGGFKVAPAFGPYRILEEIARGGQGVVLRAQHVEGDIVALKILLEAKNERACKRFEQEVGVLVRLYHPNLPRILDTGLTEGRPYVAMQLVEGQSLGERLKREGPLSAEEAIEVLAPIAQALEYCHSFGVFHRDIKPGNIVVDRTTGRPLLIDFGLLKRDTSNDALSLADVSRLSLAGELVGTPSYMAPEQADTDSVIDARTDVYGLGATFYALVTREAPFGGPTLYNTLLQVLDSPVPDPRDLQPSLPVGVSSACMRAMAKEAAERPPSPAALISELRGGLREASPEGGGSPFSSREAPSRATVALAFLAAVILIASGWLLGRDRTRPPVVAASPPTAAPAARSPGKAPSVSPSSAATPAPRRSPKQERAEPGSLLLSRKFESTFHSAIRHGPWILAHQGEAGWLAFREDALGARPVTLPGGAGRFSWDPRAKLLYCRVHAENLALSADGVRFVPYDVGVGVARLGDSVVVATEDGSLRALDPAAPDPPLWTTELQRQLGVPPLPLDLDFNGHADHLLVCSLDADAWLLDAAGAIKATLALPGGSFETPQLLSAAPGESEVLVACGQGALVRVVVRADRLSVAGRLDLSEPLEGSPLIVRQEGRAPWIAVTAHCIGLALLPADLSELAWVGRRATPGEFGLCGPAAVDLDGDGRPELAMSRMKEGGAAWVEVYSLEGEWVTRLEAGEHDVRLVPGEGKQLVAAGRQLYAWGSWRALPVGAPGPPLQERVWGSLAGQAWKAAKRGALEIGGLEGQVYHALVARHLGEGDLRGGVDESFRQFVEPMLRHYGGNVSRRALHALFGPAGEPGPPEPKTNAIYPARSPDLPGPQVSFPMGKQPQTQGSLSRLEVAGFQPSRSLFQAGGRLIFYCTLPKEQAYRLRVDQEVFNVKGTGFAQVQVFADGEPVGGLSLWKERQGDRLLGVGVLSAGEHRFELRFSHATALTHLRFVRIEPRS
jgi:serine/threonine protein kinase